jgi:hypothetical protein
MLRKRFLSKKWIMSLAFALLLGSMIFLGNPFKTVSLCYAEIPCEGDFDKDGDVDGSDLAVFATDFGKTNCDCDDSVIWKRMATKHEGDILYLMYWNYWVRSGVKANLDSDRFFRDYEKSDPDIDKLLADIGFTWSKAETEEEVWNRIGMVWDWLRTNVVINNSEYSTISSVPGEWPSILDYAQYYVKNGKLVWAACFSKAHLFAALLGRVVYHRFRFAIAEAHHTENGAPPTATHVYVAVYVSNRWFYLDPTAVYSKKFPDFCHKKSIGVDSFTTVDYKHPYTMIPIPLSDFQWVPFLPE